MAVLTKGYLENLVAGNVERQIQPIDARIAAQLEQDAETRKRVEAAVVEVKSLQSKFDQLRARQDNLEAKSQQLLLAHAGIERDGKRARENEHRKFHGRVDELTRQAEHNSKMLMRLLERYAVLEARCGK